MKVFNAEGNEIDFDAAMNIADLDLCNEVSLEMAPCSEQEFFDEYAKRHAQEFGVDFVPYVYAGGF